MVPSCLSTLAAENVRHSTRPRGSLCCLRRVWVPRPYLPTLSAYNLAVMVPFYQELGRLPPLESGWKAKDSYGPVTSPSVPRFDQTGHLLMGMPRPHSPARLVPRLVMHSCPVNSTLTTHPRHTHHSPRLSSHFTILSTPSAIATHKLSSTMHHITYIMRGRSKQ